jgi:type I restriction enzyme S subunit
MNDLAAATATGSPTAQWAEAILAEIAEINPTIQISHLPRDLPVSFVPMPAVGALTGEIDTTNVRSLSEVCKGYTRFTDGDVLFAKITPCMENGKIAVARNLLNNIGFGSTELLEEVELLLKRTLARL